EVFKANSTSLQGFQKLVAIKRVLPSLTKNERFVRMFLDEAKVSLHLNHTNIVQVFDLGIADETYFIVMEFVDGTNLKKIIQLLGERNERLPIEQAAYIALEVCKGLAHAHEKKDREGNHLSIVHRDISPPNVLISREGEIKITDFGLAKAKSQAEITDPGVVKGKFGYLSPEAAHGEDIDARTDIFAVGIVLWEMLTGRRLFLGESDYDTLKQVQEADIPRLERYRDDVPRKLQQILSRALTKERDDRFQTAEQMGRALADLLFEHGMVVSAFDIAGLVENVLETKDEETTAADVAAGKKIQRELNQLVSLEEMGNLDQFMAEHYGQITQDSEASGEYDGDGEDPREWMDLGFAGDDFGGAGGPSPGGEDSGEMHSGEAGWQEGGLQDVARATSAMPAVDGPGRKGEGAASAGDRAEKKVPPKRQPKRAKNQRAGGKPPVPPTQRDGLANSGGQPQKQRASKDASGAPTPERTPESVQPKESGDEQKREASRTSRVLLIGFLVLAILAAGVYLLDQMGVL
ncbi:MAG: serine/threonine protein kinase, partial [Persicimonas sp.]